MKILITGANGFIGKNLIVELKNKGYQDLYLCARNTTAAELEQYTSDCDFVFHLAGINRPLTEEEFHTGNVQFTETLLQLLKKQNNKAPIIFASSKQAMQENAYGKSKLSAEQALLEYEKEAPDKVFIYRLSNVFGKWCKPNYNSVVATFCHNIAHDLSIQIHNESSELNLIYIDDIIEEWISLLEGVTIRPALDHRYYIHTIHQTTLGKLAEIIESFKESRRNLQASDMSDALVKKLYSTYLTYLPEEEFSYPLKMNVDQRGSFTEILKADSFGQVSVNISKPGITKGNHWHHTKTEKFLVVSGQGIIRFRKLVTDDCTEEEQQILEYYVSGEKLEVIDIPPGYTHNITNIGTSDLVTIMWANESFNQDKPDTYFLEV
ncbi:NAD-dependent epimerase/dehydratase family protein [Clostridium aminobutyricum]|uniref:NAD-dependent epimerase/dehydratase family protein n=1 Tax=Clostridium aminobutyricum TaxID=33953 RepID=A0A939D9V8_CLOAM|nr:NAD-dependent epimerase/dehydratase family protein [Clostridium aminobutyricum]MBN7774069.1 NAD-dependent epimerase/dehydratase family protein [Clostridium aminobutyricum]